MDLLLLVGIAIILGFVGGKLGNRVRLPAVVGYIITGLFLGPSFLGLFSLDLLERAGIVSDMVLGVIAFIIGVQLPLGLLRRLGQGIVTIILAESFGAFVMVAIATYLLTQNLPLALIFGAMAPASAPAGTVAVLQEYKAKGPLTSAILAVVGFDDGLAIIIYVFAITITKSFLGGGEEVAMHHAVLGSLKEIMGTIALGIGTGWIYGYLSKRMRTRGELLTTSLGTILACTGLANFFGFSLILANLVLGIVVTSAFAVTGRRTLEVIESITPPMYVIFFVLAGAHLQIRLLSQMGLLGLIYIGGRTVGLMGGSFLGASVAKVEPNIRKYLPFGILSQAGVAIGLAILVGRELGGLGEEGRYLSMLTINTIAATTIIFEILGPITTKFAISKAGEIGQAGK